jgi:hypothetical protein
VIRKKRDWFLKTPVLEGKNCREKDKPKSRVFDPDVADEDAQNINDDRGKILRTQRSNAWSIKKGGMSCYNGWVV